MKDWQLAEYNDFARGRRLQENEIVYVEPKHKKSDRSRKIYVTEEGDTMHFISQKYGLKLKPLLRRNRMKTGDEPATGENVYLRNKRPRRA
jgi:LysM repeat protein